MGQDARVSHMANIAPAVTTANPVRRKEYPEGSVGALSLEYTSSDPLQDAIKAAYEMHNSAQNASPPRSNTFYAWKQNALLESFVADADLLDPRMPYMPLLTSADVRRAARAELDAAVPRLPADYSGRRGFRITDMYPEMVSVSTIDDHYRPNAFTDTLHYRSPSIKHLHSIRKK